MVAERHEQGQPIESQDTTNRVADFGDLRQILDGGHESRAEANFEHTVETLAQMAKDFSESIKQIAKHSPLTKEILDNINYHADKGEPLYQLLRDGHIKT
jgi:hypothetical protein